jgi:TPR repeat protein
MRLSFPSASPGSKVLHALAAELSAGSFNGEQLVFSGAPATTITIDYPEDGSIFPPEITAPTFLWRDSNGSVTSWRIDVTFPDGSKPIRIITAGDHMQVGEIDPHCVSDSNELPSLTPQQSAAHTWTADAATWAAIKARSVEKAATVTITGLSGNSPNTSVSVGHMTLTTSKDPVGAPIFYRDVPLMPSVGEKGVVQPLAPDAVHLINWRLRDIGQLQSRIVLHDMPTCANCHSFSGDGKTMGMDVDGPRNDKGLYAVVPLRPQTTIRSEDIVAWNTDETVGQSRVGFMSQVSPDGRYVLTTFAGPQHDLPSTYFVTNFKDYRFLQVFYPTRGILVFYNRATGLRQPLPGADDPRYVQTDGVWSPDGKYIVFARAEARDPWSSGQKPALRANDDNETQIQYDLYRIPFNGGKGGVPEPIAGASANGMSNNFPKVSPDGRWIVFVKCHNGQLMRPDSQLYIVPAAGGVARRMRCNTFLMNSWHSFSPNAHWLVFSSKSRSPYTQMFLTHIDEQGHDSPAIYIDRSTAANRAVNIPEFIAIGSKGLQRIDVPAADLYRVMDQATNLLKQGRNADALAAWQRAAIMQPDDVQVQNGLAIALYTHGDFDQAAEHFRLANQVTRPVVGDAQAQSYLGMMYRDGQGVPQDYGKAFDLFHKAANQDYAPAQFFLAEMYGNGLGVQQDYTLAATWYRKAADQGFVNAEFVLGVMYHDGQGVPQDNAQAMELLSQAADLGNARAQFCIGEMYLFGQGVPVDHGKALQWLRKAAAQGIVPAQNELGAMYSNGQGVPLDLAEAARWYRKAADQGSGNAQFIMSLMFHSGQGVPQDDAQSIDWLRKAADQGVPQALYSLGEMYATGNRVGRDPAEGYYLLSLANQCAPQERVEIALSQERDKVASELTSEQMQTQQERVSKWLATHSCR